MVTDNLVGKKEGLRQHFCYRSVCNSLFWFISFFWFI